MPLGLFVLLHLQSALYELLRLASLQLDEAIILLDDTFWEHLDSCRVEDSSHLGLDYLLVLAVFSPRS